MKDPQGQYTHRVTKEKYSMQETYAENPGFREIRKAPVGSVIVIHQPRLDYIRDGVIPAHNEYYEVRQRTKTIKDLMPIHTQDKKGRYIAWYGINRTKSFSAGDLTSYREIQKSWKHSDRITIYKPKKE